jgi:CHASE2 domain-containing sensor protein
MQAAQIAGIRQAAEIWGNSGPYQIVSAFGHVIAFNLSHKTAKEWAKHYGGAAVVRGDVNQFEQWQKGAL